MYIRYSQATAAQAPWQRRLPRCVRLVYPSIHRQWCSLRTWLYVTNDSKVAQNAHANRIYRMDWGGSMRLICVLTVCLLLFSQWTYASHRSVVSNEHVLTLATSGNSNELSMYDFFILCTNVAISSTGPEYIMISEHVQICCIRACHVDLIQFMRLC